MSDDADACNSVTQIEQDNELSKVSIIAGGVTITIEAYEPLKTVTEAAHRLHKSAYERCVRLPDGFGGAL